MTGARFTRANDDDLSALAWLRHRWRVEEAGETGEEVASFEARFREWYGAHRSTHVGYLASVGSIAVGCAWLCVIDRIPSPERFVRRGGMLQSVYVEPARRNGGVGEGLIRRMIDDARAMKLDYVMVHPSARSFPFYRRLGFSDAENLLELRFV